MVTKKNTLTFDQNFSTHTKPNFLLFHIILYYYYCLILCLLWNPYSLDVHFLCRDSHCNVIIIKNMRHISFHNTISTFECFDLATCFHLYYIITLIIALWREIKTAEKKFIFINATSVASSSSPWSSSSFFFLIHFVSSFYGLLLLCYCKPRTKMCISWIVWMCRH